MYGKIKWLRLTPDRPGRGGWKTGIHSFQQEPINDVRTLSGAHVYQGAWRRDFDVVAYPSPQTPDNNSTLPLSVHGYVYPSLTDPSAQPSVTILDQHTSPTGGGGTQVWDISAGVARQTRPYTNQAGVFQNINGRCFYGDGGTEALIMDDRTPAIHAQRNQSLGIGTPAQAMANDGNNNIVPDGTGYVHLLSPYINNPDPNSKLGTILAADTSVTPSIIDPNYVGIYAGAVMASTVANVDAVTSNTTPFTATGTISITSGTSLVTLTGWTWPASYRYAGLAINFNGYSYVILTTGPLGAGTGLDLNGNAIALTNTQAIIMGVYDGPTLANVPYTITGCQVTMKDTGGGNNINSLTTVNTNSAAVPPGVAFGYSQMTASNLVQIKVRVIRADGVLYRNLGNISLGPAGGGTRQTVTDSVMTTLTNDVRSATKPWTTSDVGVTMVIDNATLVGAGDMLISPITAFINSGSVHVADNNAGATVTNVRSWWGPGIISVTDGAMNVGTLDHLHSASNPFVVGDVGKTIMVAGAGNVAGTIALFTTIASFVSTSEVVLTAPCLVAAGVTGKKAAWGAGTANTTTGPSYAYAWYDPETGHCSNISPLYQIPKPTILGSYSDFANITPVFKIDPGSIAYPAQSTDGIRFSHIMFFRTVSTTGASTLYPIGSLNPFVGKVHPGSASTRGSWNPSTYHGWMGLPNNYTAAPPTVAASNYWYDWSSDTDLLLSGGFRAPQETNSKPMVLLRGGATQPAYPFAIARWDRRTWIIPTQNPHRVLYSCDEAQCPLGLPEESFPPTNGLDIPDADGNGITLKTIGNTLILTTTRWAYRVVGNNESNYRLLKVSASMPGVGYYQMDEFPTNTGAEEEPSTIFYLGRDRKVYQWTFGSKVFPVSQPIQDQLDTYLSVSPQLTTYQGARVHCVSAWGRRLVVVAPMLTDGSYGGHPTFIYDIDNQVWSLYYRQDGAVGSLYIGTSPMTTVYGLNVPVNEIYAIFSSAAGNKVLCGSWIRDDVPAECQILITTFPMNFDGKKTRKRLVSVNIHATPGAWTGIVIVNEGFPGVPISFGPYPDPLYSIYQSGGASPVDGNVADSVIMAGQFSGASGPLIGYRFQLWIQLAGGLDPMKLYAVDIAYQDEEEPGEGDP